MFTEAPTDPRADRRRDTAGGGGSGPACQLGRPGWWRSGSHEPGRRRWVRRRAGRHRHHRGCAAHRLIWTTSPSSPLSHFGRRRITQYHPLLLRPWLLSGPPVRFAQSLGLVAAATAAAWGRRRVRHANDIYDRLQRLDFARHDELQSGQLVSRANCDVRRRAADLVPAHRPRQPGGLSGPSSACWAFAGADAGGAGCPARPDRHGPPPADRRLPVHLGRPAAGHRGGRRVDEATSGVRVVKGFGQEDRELAGRLRGRRAACTDPACGWSASGPLHPGRAGHPRCRRWRCWPSAAGWPWRAASRWARSWPSPPTWSSWWRRSGCWPAYW